MRSAVVACVLALAIAALWGVLAAPAHALDSYMHGGMSGETCSWCHQDDHTDWPPTNSKCLTCHGDYDVARDELTCWTCHEPGQDMSGARNDAACTVACHMTHADGTVTTITHAAHPDKPATCTTCHPASPSVTQAGGSPHHTFVPPAVAVSGFSPASGAPGSTVKIVGAGFVRVLSVRFNGVAAKWFAIDSAAQISAPVPAGAETGPIAVTTLGGTATSAADFVVPTEPVIPAPSVAAFLPPSGFAGATVTVTGAGFTGATSVSFNGVGATFAVVSDTQLTTAVPVGAASGPITVTGPGGTGASAAGFTVLTPATASITLKLNRTTVTLGRSLKATGLLSPLSLAGEEVTLVTQRRKDGVWKAVRTVARTTGASGAYSWTYEPGRRGAYRIRAKIVASTEHTAAQTVWVRFSVR
jgi:hypothetical protein